MAENPVERFCDIAVVGDGLVGFALTRLLAGRGWKIAHFLRHREPADTGLSLSLNLSSRQILAAAGIWPHVPANAIGWFNRVQVWDSNSRRLDFSDDVGMPGYIVAQKDLLQASRTSAAADTAIARIVDPVSRLTADEAAIETTAGQIWRTHLIIAADGADSRVRELAGLSRQVKDYRQHALVCPVRCEKTHDHMARQIFLPSGPLALLPQADKNHCFIVWSTSPDEATRLRQLSPDLFATELQAASRHVLGRTHPAGERKVWPLRRLEARHYFRERLVLVGDSAHVPHPLAGAGANMGLMDAACLASILTQAADRGIDIGSRRVLRAYERRRRPVNHLALTAMDAIKRLYSAQTPLLPAIRRFGIRVLADSPPIQRRLVRAAAGLYDDWPWPAVAKISPGRENDGSASASV